MCRFAAYLGEPLLINEVISKPKDSLIKQSSAALESDVTINADGFGIGWYNSSSPTCRRCLCHLRQHGTILI